MTNISEYLLQFELDKWHKKNNLFAFTENIFNLTPIVLWLVRFIFGNHIENLILKNNWKTWLFGFSTPRIGFKFWANTFFRNRLKMVHNCPNFLYFVFTTYNINLVAPLRDTQAATTTNFVWIPKKKKKGFITWCLQFETSYQLEMTPKVTLCNNENRRGLEKLHRNKM